MVSHDQPTKTFPPPPAPPPSACRVIVACRRPNIHMSNAFDPASPMAFVRKISHAYRETLFRQRPGMYEKAGPRGVITAYPSSSSSGGLFMTDRRTQQSSPHSTFTQVMCWHCSFSDRLSPSMTVSHEICPVLVLPKVEALMNARMLAPASSKQISRVVHCIGNTLGINGDTKER